MITIKSTIVGLIILIILDMSFIYLAHHIYNPIVEEKINMFYTFMTWLILVLGIQVLVLSRTSIDAKQSLIYGAALGFVVYGVYNFTNMAMYSSTWSKTITVTDTLWGTFCTAIVAFVMYKLK